MRALPETQLLFVPLKMGGQCPPYMAGLYKKTEFSAEILIKQFFCVLCAKYTVNGYVYFLKKCKLLLGINEGCHNFLVFYDRSFTSS